MPYLTFIDDQVLEACVKRMLDTAAVARKKADEEFNRNVIDPFSIVFEMAGFKADSYTWLNSEKNRQAQKTLQDQVGNFHQAILGSFNGWRDLNVGKVVDIVSDEKKIIAEIKNKHNTVKGDYKISVYDTLEKSVMTKGHIYKGYTGYYVEIIRSMKKPYNRPFTPSDKETGAKRPSNELIRQIDGYSFYALATGIPDALDQVFNALPDVIEAISDYQFADRSFIKSFFDKAFL